MLNLKEISYLKLKESHVYIVCTISYKHEKTLKLYVNLNSCFLSLLTLISSCPQLVPSGRTVLAAPRNVTVFKNIPLAVTPKQGAVSVRPHTTAHSVRKVDALPKTPSRLFMGRFGVRDQQNEVVRNVSSYISSPKQTLSGQLPNFSGTSRFSGYMTVFAISQLHSSARSKFTP